MPTNHALYLAHLAAAAVPSRIKPNPLVGDADQMKELTLPIERKLVILIDRDLAAGLAANTAAVLTLSLGANHPELIGADLTDASGQRHLGITTLPIPVLASTQDVMREAIKRATDDQVEVVSFTSLAQSIHTYDEYADALVNTPVDNLIYSGVALYGTKKTINSITGSLPRFR